MIKVALPNKGMLFEPTQELLKACGYKASKPYKTLTQLDTKNGIEFFFLRPSDIPMYVGRGIIDGNAPAAGWWLNPKARKVARPRLVFFNRCENVTRPSSQTHA